MKKVMLFLLVFSLFLPVCSFALLGSYTVSSGTWSPTNPQAGLQYYGNNRYKLTLEATSNGDGDASITISDLGMLDIAGYSCVTVEPDGTNTPTDNFDLSIKDSNGREILTGGQGTNLSNSTTTSIYLDWTHVWDSMTISFSNMGNSKKATVTIVFDVYYP